MMKRFFALVLSVAAALSLTACGNSGTNGSSAGTAASGGAYTIKLAMTQGDVAREDSAEVTWVERFQEEVEANSNGRIKVEVYPSGQLGTADESVTGLLNNSLEMTCVNINTLNNIYPNSMVLSCPALFTDEEECDAVLTGEWGRAFFDDMAKTSGVRVLAAFCNGMRCFTSSDAPLTTVDSAKGITFRVMQSEVCEKMVSAIGANPVPMAGSEMYTALQNGTVDGQENPPVNILNDKTYEVQKYMVMDKHIASVVTFDISESFWNALPEDLRKVISDAAAAVTPEAEKVCATLNEEGVSKLEEYGLSVYTPTDGELEAWHDAMRDPCVEYVRGQVGDKVVDDLLSAIDAAK